MLFAVISVLSCFLMVAKYFLNNEPQIKEMHGSFVFQPMQTEEVIFL